MLSSSELRSPYYGRPKEKIEVDGGGPQTVRACHTDTDNCGDIGALSHNVGPQPFPPAAPSRPRRRSREVSTSSEELRVWWHASLSSPLLYSILFYSIGSRRQRKKDRRRGASFWKSMTVSIYFCLRSVLHCSPRVCRCDDHHDLAENQNGISAVVFAESFGSSW